MMIKAKTKKLITVFLILGIFAVGSIMNNGLIPNTSGGIGISPYLIGPKIIVDPVILEGEKNQPQYSNQNLENPALNQLLEKVIDGRANMIRGIYADDILALPVVQQPSGQAGFVSTIDGVVTEFSMPSSYGVTGLLAHNYLSGKYFSDFSIGDEIQIVYGDGSIKRYLVAEIQSYQALQPNSPNSQFVDLESSEQISASQLFKRVYIGDHHLTLQTCIERGGVDSWGRMFIIAYPI